MIWKTLSSNILSLEKNQIWNLFDIQKWFWCVLSDDENEKIILHKCHIWNLFDLHDCFLSSDENDKIIFDKNHIWNLFYIHEWFWWEWENDFPQVSHLNFFNHFLHIYSQITIIFTFKIFVMFMNCFDMNPKRST